MTRNYIGLASSFHDGAIAIVDSQGAVVFAEAAERPLQSKRSIGMAPDLVHYTGDLIRRYCEPDAELIAAHSWADRPQLSLEELVRRGGQVSRSLEASLGCVPRELQQDLAAMHYSAIATSQVKHFAGQALAYELGRIDWPVQTTERRTFDHHLTHAAAACFSGPFDEAVCAIVDGLGEHGSCAFYSYRDGKLSLLSASAPGGGSLGFFFCAVCVACGFGVFTGEEWKVMGLAGYGKYDKSLVEFFEGMIRVEGLDLRACVDADVRLKLHALRRDPSAAADIAYAGQQVFCEVLYQLLRNVRALGISDNLVFGGGCALNSAATGGILEHTGFRSVHAFCAPGDDGNAVGAALLAYRQDHPESAPSRAVMTPYLGSSMSTETLANVRRFSGAHLTDCGPNAPERAARLLAEGKIIGWIQGRAEFGPRALGNRSILADPRSPTIRDEINARVKFREEFRPLAPAILHEFGPDYFEDYCESPYMERALRFRPSMRARVPGVVHVDGTGRLQTVKPEWNERFARLIQAFYERTQVPLVLNTSFNVMGKPIAHSVEDVLAVFYSTGLDAVFIDDLLIEK